MPRYRFVKDPPDVLEYRGGVRLLKHSYVSVYSVEILAYKKEQPVPYSAVILCRGDGAEPLEMRLERGFDVAEGSAAERIMLALVAKGHARLVVD